MNPEDRMKLVERLREFGLDMIEGGWPTVFPLDRVFFERASTALPQEARRALVAMAPAPSAADAADVAAELLASGAGHVGLALSALGGDQEWASPELLAGATAGITALAAGLDDAKDRHVVVHVHNAFEAWRADAPRLQKLLAELAGAGAGALLLVDSGGSATPWEVDSAVRALREGGSAVLGGALLGVACRDDAETAVAGTLFAARAGAALLAGNVNGVEHAADLCAVIPTLQLKMGAPMVAPQTLAGLTTLSRAVDEQGNAPHRNNQPFVGQSAFAHKGGIHVAAVLKNEDSYQHIDPKVTAPRARVCVCVSALGVSGGKRERERAEYFTE